MKKILLATGLALASTASVSATVFDEVTSLTGSGKEYGISFIPSNLVSIDGPRIFTCDESSESRTYVLLNDDFQEIKRVNIPACVNSFGYECYIEVYFHDLNNNYDTEKDYPLTQTVFNNDDNYEYITFLADTQSYQIVNDEGEVLAKITPPGGWLYDTDVRLFKTESGFYLVINGSDEQNSNQQILLVYKIDKATSSIQQVSAYTSKMDVSPRMVRQTPITVTLGENTDYTSIDLINMSGRVEQSVPVNDEKTVIVDTSRLGHGVYVVKASGKNQSQETCKIVVQ